MERLARSSSFSSPAPSEFPAYLLSALNCEGVDTLKLGRRTVVTGLLEHDLADELDDWK